MGDPVSPQEGLRVLKIVLDTEKLWDDLTKDVVEHTMTFRIIDLKLKRLYESMAPPPDLSWRLTTDKVHEILDANNALMREMIQYKIDRVRASIPE